MYTLILSEEELAIMMRALAFYQYDCPYCKNHEYNIADSVLTKANDLIV